jgi:hypothetical protein
MDRLRALGRVFRSQLNLERTIIMWKISTTAICALALSGSLAMAQTYNQSPGGAGGPAPVQDIGATTANANQTVNGQTSSTSMLSYSNKAQSAEGMSGSNYGNGPVATNSRYFDGSQAQQTQFGGSQMQYGAQDSCGNAGAVAITDEFGNHYNCRGDRLRR